MKRKNLTKLMSLFLASILAIPTPVFAANTTEITGSVQEAVLDISASLNATYTINPNDESGNYFTANNIEIINNSNMPISIAVKDITSDNTFTDVLPDSVGSKEDWYKLAFNDSNSKIAVGLKYVSGDFIEQNQTDTLFFKEILDATEAIPIGSIAAKESLTYTLEGYHGLSFSEGKSHVTDISWQFSLYDEEGSNGGSGSGNENTVTIDKEESTVLNYDTNNNDSASAASILDDLFGVHTVAALEVVKESEINGRPVVGTATITGLKDSSATEIEIADYYEDEAGNLYEITGIKEGTSSKGTIVGASLETVTISGTNLTEVPAYAFYGNDALTKVVVEEGVTSIGMYAFHSNDALEEVTLPNSLTSIGQQAFEYCYALSTINSTQAGTADLPDNLETIGKGAFKSTYVLYNFYVPKSVDFIGYEAFAGSGTSSDKSNTVYLEADTIDELPTLSTEGSTYSSTSDKYKYFLNGGTLLVKTAELADNVIANTYSTLNVNVYEDDYFLKYTTNGSTATVSGIALNPTLSDKVDIVIPATYNDLPVSIGANAFYYKNNIASVTISDGVSSIGNQAFMGCTALTSVTMTDSVTSIGTSVFDGCTALTNVTLSNSLTSIPDKTFNGCTVLTTVNYPTNLKTIGTNAFWHTALSEIVLPEGVESIGDYAFNLGNNLTDVNRIELPTTLKTVGQYAFSNCNVLADYMVVPEGATYQSNSLYKVNTASGKIISNLGTVGSKLYGSTATVIRPE